MCMYREHPLNGHYNLMACTFAYPAFVLVNGFMELVDVGCWMFVHAHLHSKTRDR